MTFSDALRALRRGDSVRRGVWSDLGARLAFARQGTAVIPEPGGTTCVARSLCSFLAHLSLANPHAMPWAPVADDLYADDWELVAR